MIAQELPEKILCLSDDEFVAAWRGMSSDEQGLLPDEIRSAACARYATLNPWVSQAAERLSRIPVFFHSNPASSQEDEKPPLKSIDFNDFEKLEIKRREPILGAWLTEGSIGMVYSWRGLGKTWLVLWLCFCISTGRRFMGWDVPRPRPVVYVDGEMQAFSLRERALAITESLGVKPEPGMLRILSRDLNDGSFINLADPDDQRRLDEFIIATDAVIVLDNLSSLTLSNYSESDDLHHQQISHWALRHRAAGRALLFVHHAGKSGKQRGTSKREDLLDYVFTLKRPPDYIEGDGCQFVIEFEKARSVVGDSIKPIEASLITDDFGRLSWATKSADSAAGDRIIELWEGGALTLADIVREMGGGIHKSTVSRHLTTAQQKGILKRNYPAKKGKS